MKRQDYELAVRDYLEEVYTKSADAERYSAYEVKESMIDFISMHYGLQTSLETFSTLIAEEVSNTVDALKFSDEEYALALKKNQKEKSLHFRLSEGEYLQLKANAKKEGMTISDYVRKQCCQK